MTSTITMSDSVGGDFPVGCIISTVGGSSSIGSVNYLVTRIDSATTMTVKKWTWWMTVLKWNPCNNLLELI